MPHETNPADRPPADPPRTPDPGDEVELAAEEFIEQLTRAQAERDEANAKYLRTLADFQNFQRRSHQNEQVARAQGVASVVESLVPVLDHFDVALSQDPGNPAAEAVLSGIRLIREEFIKVLGAHGVSLINPVRGEEFVPGRHEAVMTQHLDDVEPGRIVSTLQPGYAMKAPVHAAGHTGPGERVIRAAKVVVRA